MKNLITLVLLVAFGLPVIGQDQVAEIVNTPSFIQEKVEGKFENIKVNLDDIEILFRNDRIEIFEKLTIEDERQTFLIFDECQDVKPVLTDKVHEEKVRIPNQAMAEVLGVSEMMVSRYSKLVYSNLYKNADLIVSLYDGKVRFELVDREGNARQLKLRTWGPSDLNYSSKGISFARHPRLNINASDSKLSLDNASLQIAPSDAKKSVSTASFEIILK